MTENFRQMVKMFSYASSGRTMTEAERAAAVSRGVRAAVAASAVQMCESTVKLTVQDIYSRTPGMEADAHEALTSIKLQILRCAKANAVVAELCCALERANIPVKIIKGSVLASLYAVPECRMSCDTDLLIDRENEDAAYRVAAGCGFDVTPRSDYSHHATCVHPDAGIVELHTELFFGRISEVIFGGVNIGEYMTDGDRKIDINGCSLRTLGYTDNLIFTVLHMIQHFIRSGSSVRQLYDVLIYSSAYRDRIDFERLYRLLDRLSYHHIYDTVLTCGVLYFGFAEDSLPAHESVGRDTAEAFMTDIERGGWIGKQREDGGELFRVFGLLRTGDERTYKKELARYQSRRVLSSVFPKKERIYSRFPFAKKLHLLPVGWLCWLCYGIRLASRGELSASADTSTLGKQQRQRLELFDRLGIIPRDEKITGAE